MVKVPLEAAHAPLPPARVQVPVIVPSVRVVPVGASPVAVKQSPSVRNWKKVTLRLPSQLTINCVVNLSPEASPAPPSSCALQPPLAANWAVAVVRTLLLPQPLTMVKASNNRTATT